MPVYSYNNYDEGGSNADIAAPEPIAAAKVEEETTELTSSLEENFVSPTAPSEPIKPWRPEDDECSSDKASKRDRIRSLFKRM